MPDVTNTSTTPVSIPIAQNIPDDPSKKSAGEKSQASINTNPAATEKAAVNQGETAIRKFKLKIDGKEMELDEPEVLRRAQMSTAAEKRFQEAANARKTAEEFVNLLRTDLPRLLDDPRLGLDETEKRAMLERYYKQKYIDPETLSPQEREIQKFRAEKTQWEEMKKQEQQQKQLEQQRLLEQHHAQNYQKLIIQGLESESLPKTEFTTRRMVDLLSKNLQMGLELTPQELAKLVKEDYINEQKALFSSTDGDVLLNLFGDEVINKIRKADLARLRSKLPGVPPQIQDAPKAGQSNEPKQWKNWDEWKTEQDRKVKELAKK